MRLKDEFKKSGYFWLPATPEMSVPGTLTIKDGGSIELELLGLLDESTEGVNQVFNHKLELGRIIGCIETHGFLTLEDCFYTNPSVSYGSISKSTVHVKMVLIGCAYDKHEAILFNSFKFSVEGIDEWVGITGIQVEDCFKNPMPSIRYIKPEDVSIYLNNKMRLSITFCWSFPSPMSQHLKEAKITQKAYFKLVSEEGKTIHDFISVAYKITTFLGFAIDKTVCIEEVSATSVAVYQDTGEVKNRGTCVMLFYESQPYAKYPPEIDTYKMLFRFEQVRHDIERIFDNWFKAYNEIDSALHLYFSAKTDAHKYIETKFLALAQGLETYHRRTSDEKLMDEATFQKLIEDLIKNCPVENQQWLSGRLQHGNELSLGQRMKSIIEPFKEIIGTSKERNKLIRSIVDTRNYLTHYNKSLEDASAQGKDLWLLCYRMEAIFQLHLLQMLGFSFPNIKAISEELNYKLHPRH